MLTNYHTFVLLCEQTNELFDCFLEDSPDFKVIHDELKLCVVSLTNTLSSDNKSWFRNTRLKVAIDFKKNSETPFYLNGSIGNEDHYHVTPNFNQVFTLGGSEIEYFFKMILLFNIVSPSKLILKSGMKRVKLTLIPFVSDECVSWKKESVKFPIIFGKTSYFSLSIRAKDVNFRFD